MDKLHLKLVIIALFLSVSTTSGFAESSGKEIFMEEVVVTAQKREENLQETPISVTAFTGEAIEALGFRQSTDITAQTPNFSVGFPNGDGGVPAPYIRGVGLNDFGVLNQGPIATYTDGTYLSSNAGQIFQLLDMERIEVLRGPQGTLYGRNATGGAVNFISRKPTQETEGWARAGYGSWGHRKIEGAFNTPINDRTAVRFSMHKAYSDGWMKNGLTGNDLNGIDEFAWRALLESQPSDNFNVLLNLHGGKSKSDLVQYRHLGVWDANGEACSTADSRAGKCIDIMGYSEQNPYTTLTGKDVPAVPGYDEGNYDLEGKENTNIKGLSATLEWTLNDMLITSITSYDDVDDFRPEETDDSPNDILTGELSVEQESFSQELRLTWDNDDWSWLAGAFYLKDKATDNTAFDVLNDLRGLFIGDDVNCTAPVGNPSGFCPEQFVFKSKSGTKQNIDSFAFFIDTARQVTEKLKISAGLRYTDEEIEQTVDYFYDETKADLGLIKRDGFPASAAQDFSDVSGRLLIDYQHSDDWFFYGGVTTGFKAGGIYSNTDGIRPFDEEKLLSYEAGFKSTHQDGILRFNGTVFYYDYEDLQVYGFFVGDDGSIFQTISNAADASVKGAEFEFQWLPNENLFVNLGVGMLSTEYKDFINPQGDFSGNTIPMSPEFTTNGLVQYDIPLNENGVVTLQLDFSYMDDVFFDALNVPLLQEEGYWLVNARASWTSANEQLEVSAVARNLANEEYMVYAFDLSFFGFNEEMIGSPRYLGLEFTYRN